MPVPSRAVAAPPNAVMQYMRLPVLFAIGLLLLIRLVFATAHTAWAVETCSIDTGGANDVTGQKDLTKMCVDNAGLPAILAVKWQWDQISWTGANTGDAC